MAVWSQVKVWRHRLSLWLYRLYARSVCDTKSTAAAAVCGLWHYINVICLFLTFSVSYTASRRNKWIIIIIIITGPGSTWNHCAVELVQEIGRWVTLITGEPKESIFSVSAVVSSPSKGKCGRFHQHLWLRLDAVAVIPYKVKNLRLCASGR